MSVLLTYTTSPNNKVYAILYDRESGTSDAANHKKAWLAESPDNENLGQWNKLIELTQSLDGNYFSDDVLSMEIHSEVTSTSGTPSYTDTVYIYARGTNSTDKLIVITINNTSSELVIYDKSITNDESYLSRLNQQQAFYIDPQGKLYLGEGTILWTSSDKGKTWEIFYDFKEYPCIIKANQNLMAVITATVSVALEMNDKKLYLAPIGSNNFQDQGEVLQEQSNVYSVFFHTINTPSKMLIVLDSKAPIKSFEYSITGTKITLKPIDEKNEPGVHMDPTDFLTAMSDMTQIGGSATIGVVKEPEDTTYYNTIQVSSKGKFGEAQLKGIIPLTDQVTYAFTDQKLTLDVNNKNTLLYLGRDGCLYLSKDFGANWKLLPLTINF